MVVVVMGVAGAGKTTVGVRLAEDLGWAFFEGDDFHPQANVEKMARGVALTDGDRRPWLDALEELIDGLISRGDDAVLACSALKAAYRRQLLGRPQVRLVYLKGDIDLIRSRLAARGGHFFGPSLLESQFEALEEPRDALVISVEDDPERIVQRIRRGLGLHVG